LISKENRNIIAINLDKNQGYGGGILKGMEELEKQSPLVLGWMWGDGQISPEILPELYRACISGADMAKATRVMRHDGIQRKLISAAYGEVMKLIGSQTKDVNGCPKLFSLATWRNLKLDSKDWFLDAQAILRAEEKGLYIAQQPTTMNKRKHGKSKVNWRTVAEFSVNLTKWSWKKK